MIEKNGNHEDNSMLSIEKELKKFRQTLYYFHMVLKKQEVVYCEDFIFWFHVPGHRSVKRANLVAISNNILRLYSTKSSTVFFCTRVLLLFFTWT